MKIGVNTLLWTAHFDREQFPLIDQVSQHGFDAIEMARFDWAGFPALEVRRALDAAGIDGICCSALTGNLSLVSEDAGVRQAALEFLTQAAAATAESGCRLLVGPFVAPVGFLCGRRRTDEEWKRAVGALQGVARRLEELDVRLAVEPLNRFETYVVNTASDAVRLCQEVGSERIGILYDTFHGNIEEKKHGEAIRGAGSRLFHLHACENDRGIPGSGHVAWEEIQEALRDCGYEGYAVIESFGFAIREIAAAACIWRDLAVTPEAIAWDGVRFLKGLFASGSEPSRSVKN
jgi:D-psicose/D-tagatose/L-ribulose 3-epimerase